MTTVTRGLRVQSGDWDTVKARLEALTGLVRLTLVVRPGDTRNEVLVQALRGLLDATEPAQEEAS